MKVGLFFCKNFNNFYRHVYSDNLNSNSSSPLTQDRHRNSSNVLQSNNNHDSSPRLPIPIGFPDPLTGKKFYIKNTKLFF
jgi:hypothetical protein